MKSTNRTGTDTCEAVRVQQWNACPGTGEEEGETGTGDMHGFGSSVRCVSRKRRRNRNRWDRNESLHAFPVLHDGAIGHVTNPANRCEHYTKGWQQRLRTLVLPVLPVCFPGSAFNDLPISAPVRLPTKPVCFVCVSNTYHEIHEPNWN